MNRWVMPRENKLVQCKYIPDTWQLLLLATFTKDMKAGLLRNICELTTTRIIVRDRIWFKLNFYRPTNSSHSRFDYDAWCASYIALYLRHLPKVTLLLVHRLRAWANIKPTLGKYIVNLMTGNEGRRTRAGEGGQPRFFRHILLKNHPKIA